VATYPFLSDDWILAARAIHAELRAAELLAGATTGDESVQLRVNVVVTTVPFGDGRMRGHLNAADGVLDIEAGHLESPQATVTLDYDTARALVVDRDTQALTRAFMSGKLTVVGDLARLLSLVARPPSPTVGNTVGDAAERIRAITA
jgi:hypothetical protein